MNISELKKAQHTILDNFTSSNQSTIVTKEVSQLWQEAFSSRINFPPLDDLIVFRRSGATYGVGDPIYTNNNELEKLCRKNAFLLRDDGVTPEFLELLSESAIGSPRLSSEHLYSFEASPNYLKNLRNAYRIFKHLSPYFGDKLINICEIGAGYGMLATMLYRLFRVRNYTIIDLSQNLYLSAFYLSANFPDKSIRFIVKNTRKLDDLCDLNFVLAEDVEKIKCNFDLIINTDSFGEMPVATARYYVEWAKEHLEDGGILHTDNRIRVPNNHGPQDFEDLSYLSDYNFFHVDGTRTQAEIFSQPHHILFLEKKTGSIACNKFWNPVALIYSVGLAESIDPYVKTGSDSLSSEVKQLITKLFKLKERKQILNLISQLKKYTPNYPFLNYLIFMALFAGGFKLEIYLDSLISYLGSNKREPADVIAMIVCISLFKSGKLPKSLDAKASNLEDAFRVKYPHLSMDLDLLIKNPNLTLRATARYAAEAILGNKIRSSPFLKISRRITGSYI